ncbi:MAG: OmpA family protein [Desulfovibrio sp.]
MKKKFRFSLAIVFVLATTLCASQVSFAAEKMVRKVDNVFFCVDTSGSMMSDYHGMKKTDLMSARELLQRMTQAMPDLGYKTALYRFAPYQELLALAPHDQAAFMAAAQDLPDQVPVFGNRTPLGNGLYDLAWPISAVPGPTAIILFTDGGQNEGALPQPVAEQLYANYDICLHLVSFANTPSEQAEVDRLAKLNACTVTASGEDLLTDPAKLEAFVRDALWMMKPVPEPPAPPAPKREFHTVRMDLYLEFDTNKSDIRPEFHDEIGKVGEMMTRYPESTAMIVGYADAVGSYVSNIHLSGDRADAVRAYLTTQFGIAPDRLESVGYGENFPKDQNDSEEGRQRNRRVTVFVTGWFVEE